MRRIVILASFLSLATPYPLFASSIIDQSCCASPNAIAGFGGYRAQTFTVGLSGQLTGIDLGLWGTGALPAFELFAGAIAPGTAVAAVGSPVATLSLINTSTPVPGSSVGGAYYFADLFAAGLFVTSGQMFTILQRNNVSNSNAGWVFMSAGSYGGGQWLTTTGNSPSTLWDGGQPGFDMVFRTYVDPSGAAVPEPSTWLLLATGLAAVAARRRFTKRP